MAKKKPSDKVPRGFVDRDTATLRICEVSSPLDADIILFELRKKGSNQLATCRTLEEVQFLPEVLLKFSPDADMVVHLDFNPDYFCLDLVSEALPEVLNDALFALWRNDRQLYVVQPPFPKDDSNVKTRIFI